MYLCHKNRWHTSCCTFYTKCSNRLSMATAVYWRARRCRRPSLSLYNLSIHRRKLTLMLATKVDVIIHNRKSTYLVLAFK
ncbi:hypothetical protein K450DRAFT_261422 [Umbelopsis ramanniana AG]|uniref:Uncharacterized protein n=1 Tax=Umbelopsis ramanniana AG TaxID=1314678 RepID=A0AAD5E2A3_UMBRA|nr:uncharacterized protein K450DRAFT_261422 [Umbelopsis ramanniana AG]KAI8575484.1 hypothetical protein K450DRAFT_261422 [Umbelopsis ramanniana AG]